MLQIKQINTETYGFVEVNADAFDIQLHKAPYRHLYIISYFSQNPCYQTVRMNWNSPGNWQIIGKASDMQQPLNIDDDVEILKLIQQNNWTLYTTLILKKLK